MTPGWQTDCDPKAVGMIVERAGNEPFEALEPCGLTAD